MSGDSFVRPKVLTEDEMESSYGAFYGRSERLKLNAANVPVALHSLLPYASFWGVADDWAREALVESAPLDVQENLRAVVAAFDDVLDAWLVGDEAHMVAPSNEYIAFSAMRMAADFI